MVRKRKIIVFIDSDAIRGIVVRALEKKGLQAIEAATEQEATRHFDGTNIDLFITDNDIKNKGCLRAIQKLRSMSSYLYTPVLMLTTALKDHIAPTYSEFNVAMYLQKPFDIVSFNKLIERFS